MVQASLVVLALAVAVVILGWFYFRRYAMTRPPIGIFNLSDVAIIMGAVILVPFFYLLLPLWLVDGLLAAAGLSILYFTWEPVLRSAWAAWLAAVLLAGVDLAAALALHRDPEVFFAANNAVIVLIAVGVANLWAQSGMKARDAALLGAALAVYDLVATTFNPLTANLFTRLAGLPFAPLLAWPAGAGGRWLGIGLGDLLLAAAFPLVMRKAFGRAAGVAAAAFGIAAVGFLILGLTFGLLAVTFPVMVVLGPLQALQYAYWRRRQEHERTYWQYLQAEPIRRSSGAGL